MDRDKSIIVTHCVNPHKFYFKYVNDCVNDEYTNFDYNIQCYGNRLYAQNLWTEFLPNKNQKVIFFDVVLNRWCRGRVTNVDEDEITLWCIDNGVIRKCVKEFALPLTKDLQQEFNLVHTGGLSVLPAENKLNLDTLDVEMQVAHYWDNGLTSSFKMIIDAAKRIYFVEELALEKHKFGSLFTESKSEKVVLINEILMQMNKAVSCVGSVGDFSSYVSEKRLKRELCQMYQTQSSTVSSTLLDSKLTSKASSNTQLVANAKAVDAKSATVVSDQLDEQSQPVVSDSDFVTSSKPELDKQLNLVKSKGRHPSNTWKEKMEPVTVQSKPSNESGESEIETDTKVTIEPKSTTSKASVKSGSIEEFNPFIRKQMSKKFHRTEKRTKAVNATRCEIEKKSHPVDLKIDSHEMIKSDNELTSTAYHTKAAIELNPFMHKKMSNGSDKSEPKLYSELTKHSNGSELTKRVHRALQNELNNGRANTAILVPRSQKNDAKFPSNINQPNPVIIDVSSFEKPKNESTVTSERDQKGKSPQRECHLKKFRIIYECGKLRQPMKSSMDWIDRLNESHRNASSASSIINLKDNDSTLSTE